jgi:hypothetical protein
MFAVVPNFNSYNIWRKWHYKQINSVLTMVYNTHAIMQSRRSQREFYLISAFNSKCHRRTLWIPIRVKGGEESPCFGSGLEDNEKVFMDGF